MAKITETVFVHYDTDKNLGALGWSRWDLRRSKWKLDGEMIFVGKAEVTFEVPDNFDPRPQQVKALEAKKRELQAQFAADVVEIESHICQLQAIEHTPSTEAA